LLVAEAEAVVLLLDTLNMVVLVVVLVVTLKYL
jgi:hypothetical protein